MVDEDILSNIDLTQWNAETKKKVQAAAKDALKKFSDGIVVDGITRSVNRTSRKEYTGSKYSEKISKTMPQAYLDKMRAASVADDIVIASTDWARDGKLEHPRTDNFVDFDHGNVLIEVGKNQYSAEVVVGITSAGNAVFYDVVDIQPTQFTTIKEELSPNVTTNKSPDAAYESSSTDNVAQQGVDVKQNVRYSSRQSQEVKQALDAFADAASDAIVNYNLQDGQKNNAPEGVRFSLRGQTQQELTANYQAEVDSILDMQDTSQRQVIVGYTPDVYEKLGMPSLPLTIGSGHVYSAAKTETEAKRDGNFHKGIHYHGLRDAAVKNIYSAIQDPVMVIAAKDVNKNATPMRSTHSVVAIVDIGTAQKSLLVPIEITAERTVNGAQMDVNTISSLYERSVSGLVSEAIALENSGGISIYYAKKEALTLPRAGVQFPVQVQQSIASNGIVHRFSEKVNMKISDVTQSHVL